MQKKAQLLKLIIPLLTSLVMVAATSAGMPTIALADPIPQGPFSILYAPPGIQSGRPLVVDVQARGTDLGTPVIVYPQNQPRTDNQLWQFVPDGTDGYGYLQSNLNGDRVLGIGGGTGPVIVWSKHGGDSQLWRFNSGYLQSKTGLVLATSGGQGTQLIASNQSSAPNQTWFLEPVPRVPPSNCHLTIQNNDPSLDDILRRFQIAFNVVCLKLVARFSFRPDVANDVVLKVASSVGATAVTSGNQITLDNNVAHQYLQQGVTGALIHELEHVMQFTSPSWFSVSPSWFTEGMADYVRSVYGPSDDTWSIPPVKPGDNYTDGYAVAAGFLHWLDQHTAPTFVNQLSHAVATGQSFPKAFQHLTGDTVDGEWSKYMANPTLAPFQRIPAPEHKPRQGIPNK